MGVGVWGAFVALLLVASTPTVSTKGRHLKRTPFDKGTLLDLESENNLVLGGRLNDRTLYETQVIDAFWRVLVPNLRIARHNDALQGWPDDLDFSWWPPVSEIGMALENFQDITACKEELPISNPDPVRARPGDCDVSTYHWKYHVSKVLFDSHGVFPDPHLVDKNPLEYLVHRQIHKLVYNWDPLEVTDEIIPQPGEYGVQRKEGIVETCHFVRAFLLRKRMLITDESIKAAREYWPDENALSLNPTQFRNLLLNPKFYAAENLPECFQERAARVPFLDWGHTSRKWAPLVDAVMDIFDLDKYGHGCDEGRGKISKCEWSLAYSFLFAQSDKHAHESIVDSVYSGTEILRNPFNARSCDIPMQWSMGRLFETFATPTAIDFEEFELNKDNFGYALKSVEIGKLSASSPDEIPKGHIAPRAVEKEIIPLGNDDYELAIWSRMLNIPTDTLGAMEKKVLVLFLHVHADSHFESSAVNGEFLERLEKHSWMDSVAIDDCDLSRGSCMDYCLRCGTDNARCGTDGPQCRVSGVGELCGMDSHRLLVSFSKSNPNPDPAVLAELRSIVLNSLKVEEQSLKNYLSQTSRSAKCDRFAKEYASTSITRLSTGYQEDAADVTSGDMEDILSFPHFRRGFLGTQPLFLGASPSDIAQAADTLQRRVRGDGLPDGNLSQQEFLFLMKCVEQWTRVVPPTRMCPAGGLQSNEWKSLSGDKLQSDFRNMYLTYFMTHYARSDERVTKESFEAEAVVPFRCLDGLDMCKGLKRSRIGRDIQAYRFPEYARQFCVYPGHVRRPARVCPEVRQTELVHIEIPIEGSESDQVEASVCPSIEMDAAVMGRCPLRCQPGFRPKRGHELSTDEILYLDTLQNQNLQTLGDDSYNFPVAECQEIGGVLDYWINVHSSKFRSGRMQRLARDLECEPIPQCDTKHINALLRSDELDEAYTVKSGTLANHEIAYIGGEVSISCSADHRPVLPRLVSHHSEYHESACINCLEMGEEEGSVLLQTFSSAGKVRFATVQYPLQIVCSEVKGVSVVMLIGAHLLVSEFGYEEFERSNRMLPRTVFERRIDIEITKKQSDTLEFYWWFDLSALTANGPKLPFCEEIVCEPPELLLARLEEAHEPTGTTEEEGDVRLILPAEQAACDALSAGLDDVEWVPKRFDPACHVSCVPGHYLSSEFVEGVDALKQYYLRKQLQVGVVVGECVIYDQRLLKAKFVDADLLNARREEYATAIEEHVIARNTTESDMDYRGMEMRWTCIEATCFDLMELEAECVALEKKCEKRDCKDPDLQAERRTCKQVHEDYVQMVASFDFETRNVLPLWKEGYPSRTRCNAVPERTENPIFDFKTREYDWSQLAPEPTDHYEYDLHSYKWPETPKRDITIRRYEDVPGCELECVDRSFEHEEIPLALVRCDAGVQRPFAAFREFHELPTGELAERRGAEGERFTCQPKACPPVHIPMHASVVTPERGEDEMEFKTESELLLYRVQKYTAEHKTAPEGMDLALLASDLCCGDLDAVCDPEKCCEQFFEATHLTIEGESWGSEANTTSADKSAEETPRELLRAVVVSHGEPALGDSRGAVHPGCRVRCDKGYKAMYSAALHDEANVEQFYTHSALDLLHEEVEEDLTEIAKFMHPSRCMLFDALSPPRYTYAVGRHTALEAVDFRHMRCEYHPCDLSQLIVHTLPKTRMGMWVEEATCTPVQEHHEDGAMNIYVGPSTWETKPVLHSHHCDQTKDEVTCPEHEKPAAARGQVCTVACACWFTMPAKLSFECTPTRNSPDFFEWQALGASDALACEKDPQYSVSDLQWRPMGVGRLGDVGYQFHLTWHAQCGEHCGKIRYHVKFADVIGEAAKTEDLVGIQNAKELTSVASQADVAAYGIHVAIVSPGTYRISSLKMSATGEWITGEVLEETKLEDFGKWIVVEVRHSGSGRHFSDNEGRDCPTKLGLNHNPASYEDTWQCCEMYPERKVVGMAEPPPLSDGCAGFTRMISDRGESLRGEATSEQLFVCGLDDYYSILNGPYVCRDLKDNTAGVGRFGYYQVDPRSYRGAVSEKSLKPYYHYHDYIQSLLETAVGDPSNHVKSKYWDVKTRQERYMALLEYYGVTPPTLPETVAAKDKVYTEFIFKAETSFQVQPALSLRRVTKLSAEARAVSRFRTDVSSEEWLEFPPLRMQHFLYDTATKESGVIAWKYVEHREAGAAKNPKGRMSPPGILLSQDSDVTVAKGKARSPTERDRVKKTRNWSIGSKLFSPHFKNHRGSWGPRVTIDQSLPPGPFGKYSRTFMMKLLPQDMPHTCRNPDHPGQLHTNAWDCFGAPLTMSDMPDVPLLPLEQHNPMDDASSECTCPDTAVSACVSNPHLCKCSPSESYDKSHLKADEADPQFANCVKEQFWSPSTPRAPVIDAAAYPDSVDHAILTTPVSEADDRCRWCEETLATVSARTIHVCVEGEENDKSAPCTPPEKLFNDGLEQQASVMRDLKIRFPLTWVPGWYKAECPATDPRYETSGHVYMRCEPNKERLVDESEAALSSEVGREGGAQIHYDIPKYFANPERFPLMKGEHAVLDTCNEWPRPCCARNPKTVFCCSQDADSRTILPATGVEGLTSKHALGQFVVGGAKNEFCSSKPENYNLCQPRQCAHWGKGVTLPCNQLRNRPVNRTTTASKSKATAAPYQVDARFFLGEVHIPCEQSEWGVESWQCKPHTPSTCPPLTVNSRPFTQETPRATAVFTYCEHCTKLLNQVAEYCLVQYVNQGASVYACIEKDQDSPAYDFFNMGDPRLRFQANVGVVGPGNTVIAVDRTTTEPFPLQYTAKMNVICAIDCDEGSGDSGCTKLREEDMKVKIRAFADEFAKADSELTNTTEHDSHHDINAEDSFFRFPMASVDIGTSFAEARTGFEAMCDTTPLDNINRAIAETNFYLDEEDGKIGEVDPERQKFYAHPNQANRWIKPVDKSGKEVEYSIFCPLKCPSIVFDILFGEDWSNERTLTTAPPTPQTIALEDEAALGTVFFASTTAQSSLLVPKRPGPKQRDWSIMSCSRAGGNYRGTYQVFCNPVTGNWWMNNDCQGCPQLGSALHIELEPIPLAGLRSYGCLTAEERERMQRTLVAFHRRAGGFRVIEEKRGQKAVKEDVEVVDGVEIPKLAPVCVGGPPVDGMNTFSWPITDGLFKPRSETEAGDTGDLRCRAFHNDLFGVIALTCNRRRGIVDVKGDCCRKCTSARGRLIDNRIDPALRLIAKLRKDLSSAEITTGIPADHSLYLETAPAIVELARKWLYSRSRNDIELVRIALQSTSKEALKIKGELVTLLVSLEKSLTRLAVYVEDNDKQLFKDSVFNTCAPTRIEFSCSEYIALFHGPEDQGTYVSDRGGGVVVGCDGESSELRRLAFNCKRVCALPVVPTMVVDQVETCTQRTSKTAAFLAEKYMPSVTLQLGEMAELTVGSDAEVLSPHHGPILEGESFMVGCPSTRNSPQAPIGAVTLQCTNGELIGEHFCFLPEKCCETTLPSTFQNCNSYRDWWMKIKKLFGSKDKYMSPREPSLVAKGYTCAEARKEDDAIRTMFRDAPRKLCHELSTEGPTSRVGKVSTMINTVLDATNWRNAYTTQVVVPGTEAEACERVCDGPVTDGARYSYCCFFGGVLGLEFGGEAIHVPLPALEITKEHPNGICPAAHCVTTCGTYKGLDPHCRRFAQGITPLTPCGDGQALYDCMQCCGEMSCGHHAALVNEANPGSCPRLVQLPQEQCGRGFKLDCDNCCGPLQSCKTFQQDRLASCPVLKLEDSTTCGDGTSIPCEACCGNTCGNFQTVSGKRMCPRLIAPANAACGPDTTFPSCDYCCGALETCGEYQSAHMETCPGLKASAISTCGEGTPRSDCHDACCANTCGNYALDHTCPILLSPRNTLCGQGTSLNCGDCCSMMTCETHKSSVPSADCPRLVERGDVECGEGTGLGDCDKCCGPLHTQTCGTYRARYGRRCPANLRDDETPCGEHTDLDCDDCCYSTCASYKASVPAAECEIMLNDLSTTCGDPDAMIPSCAACCRRANRYSCGMWQNEYRNRDTCRELRRGVNDLCGEGTDIECEDCCAPIPTPDTCGKYVDRTPDCFLDTKAVHRGMECGGYTGVKCESCCGKWTCGVWKVTNEDKCPKLGSPANQLCSPPNGPGSDMPCVDCCVPETCSSFIHTVSHRQETCPRLYAGVDSQPCGKGTSQPDCGAYCCDTVTTCGAYKALQDRKGEECNRLMFPAPFPCGGAKEEPCEACCGSSDSDSDTCQSYWDTPGVYCDEVKQNSARECDPDVLLGSEGCKSICCRVPGPSDKTTTEPVTDEEAKHINRCWDSEAHRSSLDPSGCICARCIILFPGQNYWELSRMNTNTITIEKKWLWDMVFMFQPIRPNINAGTLSISRQNCQPSTNYVIDEATGPKMVNNRDKCVLEGGAPRLNSVISPGTGVKDPWEIALRKKIQNPCDYRPTIPSSSCQSDLRTTGSLQKCMDSPQFVVTRDFLKSAEISTALIDQGYTWGFNHFRVLFLCASLGGDVHKRGVGTDHLPSNIKYHREVGSHSDAMTMWCCKHMPNLMVTPKEMKKARGRPSPLIELCRKFNVDFLKQWQQYSGRDPRNADVEPEEGTELWGRTGYKPEKTGNANAVETVPKEVCGISSKGA